MDLHVVSDSVFMDQFSRLVQSERKISAEIIEYVKEMDRRKLFLEMGFASLFQFMTEHMGYTPGSAQRRIDSARMLRDVPDIKEKLKTGELNLSQVSMLARAVREKQKSETVSVEQKRSILKEIEKQDVVSSEKTIARLLDIPIKTKETKRIQKDESVRMEITFSKEQAELLDQVKSLMSHSNPNPSVADVFEFLARKFTKKSTAKMAVKETTAKVAVKSCQWHTNGKVCGSTFQLQKDHIHPLWAGGDSSPGNFQTLCGVHNRLRYRQQANIGPKRH